MPFRDRTGPLGQGPATGWGMGPCGTGIGGRGYGRGFGRGFGRGRFWGYYSTQTPTKKEETESLSEEAGILEEELEAIKARLSELKSKK